jgi:hypothetical protein
VRKAPAIPLAAKVAGRYDVRVLDISTGGARFEHTIVLRPGDACVLHLTVKGEKLTLLGRVVWCRQVGRTTGADSRPLYESGVAFDRVPPEARAALEKFLETLFPAN